MPDPQRETMKLWDGEVSYLEWAGAGPPLLFSHATGFNAETYKSLLQPLADRFHVYAEDQRGHGFNSLPAQPGSVKDWMLYRDDLIRFLDGFDGRPMILSGHSMGATVSLMAALLRPDLVRGLVLVEPVFVPAQRIGQRWLKRKLGIGGTSNEIAIRAAKRRDTFPSLEFVEEGYRGRGAFTTWPNEVLHDYLKGGLLPTEDGQVRLACTPAWEAETFNNTPAGITGKVKPLRCPVTIIYGGLSSTCSDEEAAIFAKNHKRTRRVRIGKATHFLPMEYPEEVRKEIVRMGHRAPR